ncbi:hypothetical protein AMTR_s00047p00184420 [Amborella trichopoda]|uniref:Malectin-like domain-containing protein n=1 Tax=Amborella trichopoda TaxID=13333 RepID=U5DBP0_AMBTC|nr:hypothetical protein AMTR_s00047p00184420 [Amborella trichopoda]
MDLQYLNLSNNTLSGEIPPSLRNCSKLRLLDLGDNRLLGKIPSWIGKSIKSLHVLRLRSNMFEGEIPWGISHLHFLQVLDLTLNCLSGTFPAIFNNLTAMVLSKTPLDDYILYFVPFEGLYPYNPGDVYIYVNGKMILIKGLYTYGHGDIYIDANGKMRAYNWFYSKVTCEIPPNMPSMTFLSTLNLSFNNLSGPIPYSGRTTTFEASSYYGNLRLCGPSLPLPEKKCTCNKSISNSSNSRDMRNRPSRIPWMSVDLGFGFGFSGFFSVIFVPRQWSHSILE